VGIMGSGQGRALLHFSLSREHCLWDVLGCLRVQPTQEPLRLSLEVDHWTPLHTPPLLEFT